VITRGKREATVVCGEHGVKVANTSGIKSGGFIVGASLSEPHIDEFAVEFLSIYVYIYIYILYISYVVP